MIAGRRERGGGGLIVEGKLQGKPVQLLVDTGASVNMVSAAWWADMAAGQPLQPTREQIYSVEGRPLQLEGEVTGQLQLGRRTVRAVFVVAEMGGEAILGATFLREQRLTVDLGGEQLRWGTPVAECRVVSVRPAVITGGEEAILEGRVTGPWRDGDDGIVERTTGHKGDHLFVVGRGLVRPEALRTYVRVLNPGREPVVVYRNTTLGEIERVVSQPSPVAGGGMESEGVRQCRTTTTARADEVKQLVSELVAGTEDHRRREMADLIRGRVAAFQLNKEDKGHTDLARHSIDTGSTPPIKQPPRRLAPHRRETIAEEVDKMLEAGVIEESVSPWASPVVLVKKKDGTTRFCVDYRRLNAATVKDAYPLPRVEDCLDTMAGAAWFSSLDLASGYWQLDVAEGDKEKTAFTTHRGLYQFRRMPFGLCNAPGTFERVMEIVMRGLQWRTCLVYLDDIVVFSASFEEHLARLGEVLDRLIDAGLKVKASKCQLGRRRIGFLGHVVSKDGVQTDPAKVEAVESWPEPISSSEVRSFLGLAGYYRAFVPNFSTIAKPLSALAEKGRAFAWSAECGEAFSKLKELLTQSPILAFPHAEGQLILDTDASNTGLGVVLAQEQAGQERVLAYGSRTLSKPERNYCVTRRELLAIVFGLRKFRHYLIGRPVRVRTDHSSLRWLLDFKEPEGQLARWLQVISTYDLVIQHRPGKLHGNADGLSRRPCKQCGREEPGYGACRVVTRSQGKEDSQEEEERGRSAAPAPPASGGRKRTAGGPDLPDNPVSPDNTALTDNAATGGPGSPDNPVTQDNTASTDNAATGGPGSPDSPTSEEEVESGEDEGPQHTPEEWVRAQDADAMTKEMKEWYAEGRVPPTPELVGRGYEPRAWASQLERLTMINGVIGRWWTGPAGRNYFQLAVPAAQRAEVLHMCHGAPLAGHLGRNRTLRKVQEGFYWPDFRRDVTSWCARCEPCVRRKSAPPPHRSPMGHVATGLCRQGSVEDGRTRRVVHYRPGDNTVTTRAAGRMWMRAPVTTREGCKSAASQAVAAGQTTSTMQQRVPTHPYKKEDLLISGDSDSSMESDHQLQWELLPTSGAKRRGRYRDLTKEEVSARKAEWEHQDQERRERNQARAVRREERRTNPEAMKKVVRYQLEVELWRQARADEGRAGWDNLFNERTDQRRKEEAAGALLVMKGQSQGDSAVAGGRGSRRSTKKAAGTMGTARGGGQTTATLDDAGGGGRITRATTVGEATLDGRRADDDTPPAKKEEEAGGTMVTGGEPPIRGRRTGVSSTVAPTKAKRQDMARVREDKRVVVIAEQLQAADGGAKAKQATPRGKRRMARKMKSEVASVPPAAAAAARRGEGAEYGKVPAATGGKKRAASPSPTPSKAGRMTDGAERGRQTGQRTYTDRRVAGEKRDDSSSHRHHRRGDSSSSSSRRRTDEGAGAQTTNDPSDHRRRGKSDRRDEQGADRRREKQTSPERAGGDRRRGKEDAGQATPMADNDHRRRGKEDAGQATPMADNDHRRRGKDVGGASQPDTRRVVAGPGSAAANQEARRDGTAREKGVSSAPAGTAIRGAARAEPSQTAIDRGGVYNTINLSDLHVAEMPKAKRKGDRKDKEDPPLPLEPLETGEEGPALPCHRCEVCRAGGTKKWWFTRPDTAERHRKRHNTLQLGYQCPAANCSVRATSGRVADLRSHIATAHGDLFPDWEPPEDPTLMEIGMRQVGRAAATQGDDSQSSTGSTGSRRRSAGAANRGRPTTPVKDTSRGRGRTADKTTTPVSVADSLASPGVWIGEEEEDEIRRASEYLDALMLGDTRVEKRRASTSPQRGEQRGREDRHDGRPDNCPR